MKRLFPLITALLVLISYPTLAEEFKEISWEDMMPTDWVPSQEVTHDGLDAFEQIVDAPIVPKLNKQKIKLPGYILPVKYTHKSVSEFLLVPYMGACVHVPPPPSNQMVYVTLKEPMEVEELWEPVWVTGLMVTEVALTEYASAGYHLKHASAEKYIFEE